MRTPVAANSLDIEPAPSKTQNKESDVREQWGRGCTRRERGQSDLCVGMMASRPATQPPRKRLCATNAATRWACHVSNAPKLIETLDSLDRRQRALDLLRRRQSAAEGREQVARDVAHARSNGCLDRSSPVGVHLAQTLPDARDGERETMMAKTLERGLAIWTEEQQTKTISQTENQGCQSAGQSACRQPRMRECCVVV